MIAAARLIGRINPVMRSCVTKKQVFKNGTFTRKYHEESDMLVENTVEMSDSIKSEG